MTESLRVVCDHDHSCITCGDEAVEMRVLLVETGRIDAEKVPDLRQPLLGPRRNVVDFLRSGDV